MTVGELRRLLAEQPDHYPVVVGREYVTEVTQTTQWGATPGVRSERGRPGAEPLVVVVLS
jgi:hypothetical protein